MPSRQDIIDSYTVRDSMILDLGQFQGEMLYTPYFYHLMDNGETVFCSCPKHGNSCDCVVEVDYVEVEITDKDRREFPELAQSRIVRVRIDGQGFVSCEVLP